MSNRHASEAIPATFGRVAPDELFDAPRARSIMETHNAVRQPQRPVFLRSRYFTTKNVDMIANRLYLPLSDDDREVNMILGALTLDFGAITPVGGAWGSSARLDPAGSQVEMVDAESA